MDIMFVLSDDDTSFDHTIGLTSSTNTSFESTTSDHVIINRTLTDVTTPCDLGLDSKYTTSNSEQQQQEQVVGDNRKNFSTRHSDATTAALCSAAVQKTSPPLATMTSPAKLASPTLVRFNDVAPTPFDASHFRIDPNKSQPYHPIENGHVVTSRRRTDDVISCDGDDEREDDDEVHSLRNGASDMAGQLLQVSASTCHICVYDVTDTIFVFSCRRSWVT